MAAAAEHHTETVVVDKLEGHSWDGSSVQTMGQVVMIVASEVVGVPDHLAKGRVVEDHAAEKNVVAAGCCSAATGEQDSLEVQDRVGEDLAVEGGVLGDLCIVQQKDYGDYIQ